jgi:hypothetical protein
VVAREVYVNDWRVLGDQVRSRLQAVDKGTAVAFATITAERLMRLDQQKQPFTASLRPLLDLVWRAAAGDQMAYKPIAVALGEFYIGDYCHNDGQDGPDDADDDPAAAILYAAECYFHGMPDFAALVASRAVDAADYRAELASEEYDGDEDVDWEAEAEVAMTAEVRQQLADLDALVPYAALLSHACMGLPIDEHERLLAELRGIG